MRFDLPESITAMRAGRKSQTRRPTTYWLKKQPGDRITIVHKGEYLGHATVVRVWRETLGSIGEGAAICEGYSSVGHFLVAWHEMHPEAHPHDVVTAIEFKDIRWK